jgi:hypothetical protein
MPIFLIERSFAQQLEMNAEIAAALNKINDAAGVEWLISFLSADKKRPTACMKRLAPRPFVKQPNRPAFRLTASSKWVNCRPTAR